VVSKNESTQDGRSRGRYGNRRRFLMAVFWANSAKSISLLWADDVPTCPVEIRAGGEIWVKPVSGYDDRLAIGGTAFKMD
jgi:hypothetical protein